MHTNVTHEHLEFHGTPEAYRAAKRRLFERLAVGPANPDKGFGKHAVVNLDDPLRRDLRRGGARGGCDAPRLWRDPGGDAPRSVSSPSGSETGCDLTVRTPRWEDRVHVRARRSVQRPQHARRDRGRGGARARPGRDARRPRGARASARTDGAGRPGPAVPGPRGLRPHPRRAGQGARCPAHPSLPPAAAAHLRLRLGGRPRCRQAADDGPRGRRAMPARGGDRRGPPVARTAMSILEPIAAGRRARRPDARSRPAAHRRSGDGHPRSDRRRRARATSWCLPARATSGASRRPTARSPGMRPAPRGLPSSTVASASAGRLPAMAQPADVHEAPPRRVAATDRAIVDMTQRRRPSGTRSPVGHPAARRSSRTRGARSRRPPAGSRGATGSTMSRGRSRSCRIQERDLAAPVIRRDTGRDPGPGAGRRGIAGPLPVRAAGTGAAAGRRRGRDAALRALRTHRPAAPCGAAGRSTPAGTRSGPLAAALPVAGFVRARRPVQVSTTGMFVPLHADEEAAVARSSTRTPAATWTSAARRVSRSSVSTARPTRMSWRAALASSYQMLVETGQRRGFGDVPATGRVPRPGAAATHRGRARVAVGGQPRGPGARPHPGPPLGRPGDPVRGRRGGRGRRPGRDRTHRRVPLRGQLPAPVDDHPLGCGDRLRDLRHERCRQPRGARLAQGRDRIPLWSLFRFKSQWGAQPVQFVGAWEFAPWPLLGRALPAPRGDAIAIACASAARRPLSAQPISRCCGCGSYSRRRHVDVLPERRGQLPEVRSGLYRPRFDEQHDRRRPPAGSTTCHPRSHEGCRRGRPPAGPLKMRVRVPRPYSSLRAEVEHLRQQSMRTRRGRCHRAPSPSGRGQPALETIAPAAPATVAADRVGSTRLLPVWSMNDVPPPHRWP